MISYAVKVGNLTTEHFELFEEVQGVVGQLPNNIDFTCHQVCEIVAKEVPGLVWVKGKFHGFEHSWLEVRGDRIVIDAYPWGGAIPFMVVAHSGSPWAFLYQENPF